MIINGYRGLDKRRYELRETCGLLESGRAARADREPRAAAADPARAADAAAREASTASDAAAASGRVDTAESLYREADEALASGDRDRARAALLAVVTEFPADPLADTARYELATLVHAASEHDAALRYLDGIDDRDLSEPVDYLRCRVLVARGAGAAARCLQEFRSHYPQSAHDAAALYLLADLHCAAGAGAAARPLLAAYVQRYSTGPAAAAARTRLDRCAARE
jgi:TolA-binding protein